MMGEQGPMVGRRAAAFQLPDVQGRTWTLDDFRDQWLLLVFHRHLA